MFFQCLYLLSPPFQIKNMSFLPPAEVEYFRAVELEGQMSALLTLILVKKKCFRRGL